MTAVRLAYLTESRIERRRQVELRKSAEHCSVYKTLVQLWLTKMSLCWLRYLRNL